MREIGRPEIVASRDDSLGREEKEKSDQQLVLRIKSVRSIREYLECIKEIQEKGVPKDWEIIDDAIKGLYEIAAKLNSESHVTTGENHAAWHSLANVTSDQQELINQTFRKLWRAREELVMRNPEDMHRVDALIERAGIKSGDLINVAVRTGSEIEWDNEGIVFIMVRNGRLLYARDPSNYSPVGYGEAGIECSIIGDVRKVQS
ncbi:hypothetical protein A2763_04050 [Candidatus Kaiserbacteria bacterium RIFCSPHIGHO2_01_FULL_54_36]|uniref:Uncharacterized protein n=1 Tax=Candidatus Kaiserbacteria bacterium RIFCSPHIGHO2_01_FULL_54_36 TaxID=1798482 RepID=A0A1F6CK42_9BACT|nr:MAG: hypothetical protein A2763_04050 [Candidatus Kaiserbacteria bacterium RIFCSPHIGHO2_01_FULL_54_36]OGG75651.1 MAG: hypothetical protein A3A41_00860 [Candidatus Kaiserbacteria bacterium RIFCSPLOWO2_01_FULL_54_22]